MAHAWQWQRTAVEVRAVPGARGGRVAAVGRNSSAPNVLPSYQTAELGQSLLIGNQTVAFGPGGSATRSSRPATPSRQPPAALHVAIDHSWWPLDRLVVLWTLHHTPPVHPPRPRSFLCYTPHTCPHACIASSPSPSPRLRPRPISRPRPFATARHAQLGQPEIPPAPGRPSACRCPPCSCHWIARLQNSGFGAPHRT